MIKLAYSKGWRGIERTVTMEKLTAEMEQILAERYGKDSVVALATLKDGIPCVRFVNGVYIDGAYYVITYALSDKMKQMEKDSHVAVAAEWFTAHGIGGNLGWVLKEENAALTAKLREAFASWIDNGHTDFEDENTCILQVRLTDGVLWSHGTRYEIDFS